MNSNKNPIYSHFKTKDKRKLVIFKHTHPVYLSQSQTGHIATENHSHNFRFPLALLLRFIVSFSFFSEIGRVLGGGGWAFTWYITLYTILVQKWGVCAYMVMGAYKVLYSNIKLTLVSCTQSRHLITGPCRQQGLKTMFNINTRPHPPPPKKQQQQQQQQHTNKQKTQKTTNQKKKKPTKTKQNKTKPNPEQFFCIAFNRYMRLGEAMGVGWGWGWSVCGQSVSSLP